MMSNAIKRKCKFLLIEEKSKMSTVAIMIGNIMPKECVTIVIIRMVEPKNHGNVSIKSYMLMDYVKTATSINIIK